MREAAAFAHVSWTEFDTMDVTEQAAIVGHYRMHHIIEAHAADASRRYNSAMSKVRD